jgi:hypothetical protein
MANTSKVNRTKPSQTSANQDAPNRGTAYGEQMVNLYGVDRSNLCDEGSYFVVTNATFGTGIVTPATGPVAYSDTAPFFLLNNTDTASGTNKNVTLDYLKLICTVSGTAGTSIHYVLRIDNSVARYTSGATTLGTIANCNMNSSVATVCTAYCGAITVAAATANVRTLGNGIFKTGIPIVGDTYVLTFGVGQNGVGSSVATIAAVMYGTSPIVIGPGQCFLLHLWLPAQTGASSYEIEVAWWER